MSRFSVIIISIISMFALVGVGYIILNNPILNNPFTKESLTPEAPPPTPATTEVAAPAEPLAAPENITPPAQESAPNFEDKLARFRQTITDVATTGESQQITLVFTEAEVNDQAAKVLAQTEIPEDIPLEVNSIHIDLQPGNNLLTEAKTVVLGLGVTLKAKTQVSLKEGKPEITVSDVSFGFVPLPGAVKDKIVAFIVQKTDDVLGQLTGVALSDKGEVDLEFKEVNVQEENITITVLIKKVI